jgi:tRNA (guanine37-N1)-methyltransferase
VKIDIITLFPGMVKGPLAEGIVGRAIDRGLLDVQVHDLRDYTTDRHRVVDDMPFGGGPGMVLKPEPLFAAVEHIREQRRREAEATDAPKPRRSLVRLRAKRFGETTTEPEGRSRGEGGSTVILTSPDGERLTHAVAERLSALEHIVVLCGRYEGVDERVRTALATETLSIGDYVLSGGELPALVIVDAIARFVPGVVGDEESVARDTFARGLLDYPQYTRPAEFRGVGVPPVVL